MNPFDNLSWPYLIAAVVWFLYISFEFSAARRFDKTPSAPLLLASILMGALFMLLAISPTARSWV